MTSVTRSDVFNAITSHNADRILEALKDHDVNYKFSEGNVLLWAITGSTYNNKDAVGKGNYNTVKLLLDIGANPNIQFLVYDPLYYATNEKQADMIVLLINYGANPNSYHLKVMRDSNDNDICDCKTPLVHAIEQHSVLCVEALVHRGAIFNTNTIEHAQKIRDNLFERRKQSAQDYLDYEYADKICLTLKDAYDQRYEQLVVDYLKENSMTFKKMNYFVGFEK